jgi:hypothetical protein
MSTDRFYLEVSEADEAEARALGARRDEKSRRWYIGSGENEEDFSRWLPADAGAEEDEEFTITSDRAYVAAATAPCQNCRAPIEVICIYCEDGIVMGEPLTEFTVSNIRAVDSALAAQLTAWPAFREVHDHSDDESYFANHCSRCGAPQEDLYLHSEPDQPLFSIPRAEPGAVRLTPLAGRIRLSGDESFEV